MSGKFDVTINRSGYTPSTDHDQSSIEVVGTVARVTDAVLAALAGGDQDAKVSFTIRPAKTVIYEVWFSGDAANRHCTTFSQRNYAINHAKLLHDNDGRHYYVKQRRGRKSVIVWTIGDPV